MRNFRYPNAIPPLGSIMVGKDGQPTEEWRRYFEAVTTQLGGQGGDQLDDMRTLSESDNTRDIEELRALIDQLQGQISDTSSQLEQAKQDAERQLAVISQEVATASALRPLGPLAEKSAVATSDIEQNAITNADSSEATADRSAVSTTQAELARHTQTLTSGSTVIIDVRFTYNDIGESSGFTANLSAVGSPNRDVLIRLVRDPDGSADVLTSYYMLTDRAFGTDASATAARIFEGYSFRYKDAGHSGGSVTYAVDIVSYNTGTTTANGISIGWQNLRRLIHILETKR